MIADLPRFNQQAVRDEFLKRVTPNMTEAAKSALNDEYVAALAKAESETEARRKEASVINAQAFLADPATAIKELREKGCRTFSLGEMLLGKGIATATQKRHGKGVTLLPGSDFSYIGSNFTVTARIGNKTLTEEVTSSNDYRDKDNNLSMVAEHLARQIALEQSGSLPVPHF